MSGFWRAWLGEVDAMWPRRHLGTPPPRRFAVAYLDGPRLRLLVHDGRRARELAAAERRLIEEGTAKEPRFEAALRRIKRSGLPLILRLPAERAAVARDALPRDAEPELRAIVGHKLDLLTPFAPEQAYYDAVVLDRPGRERIEVGVVAVPKPDVDRGLALLRRLGLEATRADIVDDDAAEAPQIDLLATDGRKAGSAWGLLWPLVLLVPLALAGGAYAYLDISERAAQLDERQNLTSALAARVADLPELRTRLDGLRAEAGFIARQRLERPSALVAFEGLSRLLPDDVWLDALDLEGDRLTLAGYAPDASELVPLLEGAPNFSNVAFTAPSTRVEVRLSDATVAAERFSLAARVGAEREP